MSGFWNMIGQNLVTHAEAYGVGGFAILISAIKNMPRPGVPASWLTIYTWLYETLQSALPIPRSGQTNSGTLNGVPIPPQPVIPASTK
jgi:hypothetical protein